MKLKLIFILSIMCLGSLWSVHAKDNKLEGYVSPVLLLRPVDWAGGGGSSSKEQAYFHGVLETYGFFLYGYWPREHDTEQQFSDYRACVDDNKNRPWLLSGWLFGEALKASAAAQMIRQSIPLVCSEYAGKGRGGWKPPRIVAKKNWQDYGVVERRWYVTAYVEAAVELASLAGEKDDVATVVECMKKRGIDAVLKKLDSINFEWEFAMPWTVSRAMGSACK